MSDGGRHVFLRGSGQRGTKDGITYIIGDALSAKKGEIASRQIARTPSQQLGIERHDEGTVTSALGPGQQAGGKFFVFRPIKLEPMRAASNGLSYLFQAVGGQRA